MKNNSCSQVILRPNTGTKWRVTFPNAHLTTESRHFSFGSSPRDKNGRSQLIFCHMRCLFCIYKYSNCLGYSANATDSSVSHNIWMDHLTNCSRVRTNQAPQNLWRPWTRPSGQEEEAASLLLPEIIIFHNLPHLNRANQVREQKQGARQALPPTPPENTRTNPYAEADESLLKESG